MTDKNKSRRDDLTRLMFDKYRALDLGDVLHLATSGADINAHNEEGHTLLALAIRDQLEDFLTALLNQGANPNTPSLPTSKTPLYTPLHHAAAHMDETFAEKLIAHGAHVNAREATEKTPLHIAAIKADVGTVRLLLNHDADPTLRDNKMKTARRLAAEQALTPISQASLLTYRNLTLISDNILASAEALRLNARQSQNDAASKRAAVIDLNQLRKQREAQGSALKIKPASRPSPFPRKP